MSATQIMPALFLGHGSPMNALQNNTTTKQWQELGQTLPRPRAILLISAHWLTRGTAISTASRPQTIHDFGGFPAELFAMQYPAAGAPELAEQIAASLSIPVTRIDSQGLDHGSWSALVHLYPEADIPVFQLSLDQNLRAQQQFQVGRELRRWREQGVLIIGSGNVVHNLRALAPGCPPLPWASRFNQAVAESLMAEEDPALLDYKTLVDTGTAELCHPTDEHLQPLFYLLGSAFPGERRLLFNNSLEMGAISMLSLQLG
ncbi:4,5-DOPA dioxygenase extradiol [Shewanella algae]|uniref:4,5-DOPA-extradiol-dioxygenase n=1 Tax=Shewanella algae TaxID=38313 RepID=UPI000D14DC8F|nr:4,5-DOPA dioxygenase extradiol [Shewanella algae]PST67461.1 dioxygenase [Shewanella algae]TVO91514.1 dioxygenase [Shewanella algae]TXS87639.1 dioxygenase [Shewanella algae]